MSFDLEMQKKSLVKTLLLIERRTDRTHLSRQSLQTKSLLSAQARRSGFKKVATSLILKRAIWNSFLATGSELPLAIQAAEKIGSGVRVVSIPCFERFERQSDAYKSVLFFPLHVLALL